MTSPGMPSSCLHAIRPGGRKGAAPMKFLLRCAVLSTFLLLLASSLASAATPKPMKLVGSLMPWQSQFGAVVVDATRGVAYMGSLDPYHGPAVIDIRNREHPVL